MILDPHHWPTTDEGRVTCPVCGEHGWPTGDWVRQHAACAGGTEAQPSNAKQADIPVGAIETLVEIAWSAAGSNRGYEAMSEVRAWLRALRAAGGTVPADPKTHADLLECAKSNSAPATASTVPERDQEGSPDG